MMRAGVVLVAACCGQLCLAGELELYLMEVPPLTMNTVEQKGVVGDIVLEAMRRAGYTARLVVVPSNRALAVVANPASTDRLIIPLARLPEREDKYTWIAPVVRVQRAFFTVDRHIESFDAAREALNAIGVSRGTAGVDILRKAGFGTEKIYEVNQAESGFRMLLMGRIDAWFGPLQEGLAMRKAVDASDRINVGAPLGATYNYLGCSRSCDRSVVEKLSQTLHDMERDGSAKSIMRQYGLRE